MLGVVAFLLLSLAACIILYGLYNAFLHPLSKYPGPRLWGAYRLPYVIRNVQGRLPFLLLEFHRKYGPVVRIAPDEVAFTDPAAWNDIYGLLPGRRQNQRDKNAYVPASPGWENDIMGAEDTYHAKLRKIYNPAFTLHALDEQGDLISKYANLMIDALKRAVAINPSQDMAAWFTYVMFDIAGEFTLGESFDCLKNGKPHFFVKTVNDGVVAGLIMGQLERYGIVSMLSPLIPESVKQPKVDMDNYTAALLKKRLEAGVVEGRTDVFNYLLANLKEQNETLPSIDVLIQNAETLVVAGSETNATFLPAVVNLLCRNPKIKQRVINEVRSTFKSSDEIDVKSVRKLSYLIDTLTECMRIFPASGFGFPRIINNNEGQLIAGNHHMPKGSKASVWHYATYHYEKNFFRPDELVPERWMDHAPQEYVNDQRDAFQPFHIGPRACLGQNFARAEMRCVMAQFLFHFDFELADPNDDWQSKLKGYLVWSKGEKLMVKLKPVEDRKFKTSK